MREFAMPAHEMFHFTTKDLSILETMLDRMPDGGPAAALIARKLAGARVWLTEDVPPTVVTLNSRVRFRLGDAASQTRVVALNDPGGSVGGVLPLTNLRGLALIGLQEGCAFAFDGPAGLRENVTLEAVMHQPEAARRVLRADERSRRTLRLVYSATEAPAPRMRIAARDDDPGPSAA
jgi:regulator of nucleoside diphosphate kinase